MFKLLDETFLTPEENLACDEALLILCDQGKADECLRFWESKTCFVVAGYSNKISREVNIDSCRSDNIPLLRRISGGGTVLQGPGCLNYSLILRIDSRPELATPITTNHYIMERHRLSLESMLKSEVTIQGDTDLAIQCGTRNAECKVTHPSISSLQCGNPQSEIRNLYKFSGNAQRRLKNALLFHGTYLLSFDLSRMEKYLTSPSKQPAYREDRPHQDFITNVPLSPASLKSQLRSIWNANQEGVLSPAAAESITHLIETKYSLESWNQKF